MEKLTSIIPKEDIRALVQRLRMMYRSDPDEIAYRLGDLLNIPKQEAYRLAIESAPSLRHTVDDLFTESHEDDCEWITINGQHVCVKDRTGDGKGDLPERFGGPKETGKSADFTMASSNHAKFAEAHKDLIGYSFNPTSNKGFSAYKEDGSENTEVNKGIHKDYSDGENPVYFIGITNHQGGLSRESESAYNQASGEGHTPLIGYFKGDIEYTDISYPVNAGISEAEVKKLLDNHAQESALVIDKAGKVTFLPGANIKPPKGGKAPLP